MLSKISHWLGRLSVGRKLTLIYLLDLTAVIYVSGILIHEKYLAIDFARKEIVGANYTEVVRHNVMDTILAAPGNAPAARAHALQAMEQAQADYDSQLNTGGPSARLHAMLDTVAQAVAPGGVIEIRLAPTGPREAMLEICDDGPGVPAAERTLLFREHARLSVRPTAGEESHGLGLAKAAQLAAAFEIGSRLARESLPRGPRAGPRHRRP